MNNDNTVAVPKQKRPLFLRVLCIMSFTGIGYVVASSIYDLIFYTHPHAVLGKFIDPLVTLSDKGAKFILYSRLYMIISVIAALICLAGVIQMWRLKKNGFVVYVIGELAPVFALFFVFRSFYTAPFLSIAFMTPFILKFLVALAFIIMYSMNVKRMN